MKRRKTAYNGKFVDYKNKLYTLVPEVMPHMCEGCDLYNRECTKDVTELCTQGFILKKVSR